MKLRTPLAVAALLAAALPAARPLHAGTPPTRTEILLVECRTVPELRARLEAFADSGAATEPFESADACVAVAATFERVGQRDSAITWYARALQRRGDAPERLGLADNLLERRGPQDVQRALTLMSTSLAGIAVPEAQVPYRARAAWGLYLSGKPDSAATLFAGIEDAVRSSTEWTERMGFTALAARRPGAALRWLSDVALASRGQAKDVMDSLRAAGEAMPAGAPRRDLRALIQGQVVAADRAEERWLGPMGGRRVSFTASDGFPLGAVTFGPAEGRPRRGIVVLLEPGESPASCDSLAAILLRANLGVILLERRGYGRSVGSACPLPHAWRGREEALEERCARDVREALRALAGAMPLDTARYVVAGIGETAGSAVRAASLDRRVAALLLISPDPPPVTRGVMRARLAAWRRPAYFQLSPEDLSIVELADAFYQVGDRPASRVADGRGSGRGAVQFRHDPDAGERLRRWLGATLAAPPRPRPAARRRG